MNPKPLLISLCLIFRIIANAPAEPMDPIMGDWQGIFRIDGQPDQKVVFQMIPHGGDTYEARVVERIDERVPLMHQLSGQFTGGQFRMMEVNEMSFHLDRILRPVDGGLVYRGSLWSGTIDERMKGIIVGERHGGFELQPAPRKPSPTLGLKPPAGAVILFDGTTLDAWTQRDPRGEAASWTLTDDGAMQITQSDLITKEKFDDFRLHLEFLIPYEPYARDQSRGNSGVYLQGHYEIQILDSYGQDGADNHCGGIYQIAKPLVNMCHPPLFWQTYDIMFTSARWDETGMKTANARVTVVHNGVTIHDDLELPHHTPGGVDENEHLPDGLMLQDHGSPIRFRNIWILRM